MKKKVNTLKFVLVALLVLHGTSALGQDKIDEIQNTVGKTIVRNQDSSHYIVCHQSEQWDPYFSIIDENDNDVKQCIIPKGVVKEVTDFIVKGNNIYMCGQLYEDSAWFFGRINLTNFSETHPTLLDCTKVYYVSKLAKLQYESDAVIVDIDYTHWQLIHSFTIGMLSQERPWLPATPIQTTSSGIKGDSGLPALNI